MKYRLLLLFPVLLLVVIRQIYANLLHANRDALTVVVLGGLTVFALVAFQLRLQEVRRDLLAIDFITIGQFLLAGVAIAGYFLSGRIAANETVAAVYYYCLAPFLIYAGFTISRWQSQTQRAALIGLALVYGVTLWVAIYESLGIDFWLFAYDRWELQKNFLGVARASGLYGTQIDYGFLSFLTFAIALYCNSRRGHWFTILLSVLAAIGVVLAMSRVWIAATIIVSVVRTMTGGSFGRKLKAAAVIAVAAVVLFSIADDLGVVSIIKAEDAYTQDSNETHFEPIAMASQWLLHDYLFVGTGPGTQNGPDARGQKFVSDFLWMGFMVDFGTMIGAPLVLCRVLLISTLLARSFRSRTKSALRPLTIVACLTFLLASFVNSAYVHLISISAFYIIVGLFIRADRIQPPSMECARALPAAG